MIVESFIVSLVIFSVSYSCTGFRKKNLLLSFSTFATWIFWLLVFGCKVGPNIDKISKSFFLNFLFTWCYLIPFNVNLMFVECFWILEIVLIILLFFLFFLVIIKFRVFFEVVVIGCLMSYWVWKFEVIEFEKVVMFNVYHLRVRIKSEETVSKKPLR